MPSLTISATLASFQTGNAFYSDPSLATETPTIGVVGFEIDGKNAIQNTVTVGTADETLDKGDIGTIGYAYIKNLEAALCATPGAPTVTPVNTGGGATWTYKIVAFVDSLRYTVASGAGTTTAGNATLDETNYNHLQWAPIAGASSYDIYRTASGGTPSTTGFVANVLFNAITVDTDGLTYVFYDDVGDAGDSSSPPSTTPYDFKIIVGSDGSSYPIKVKGNGIGLFEWNATNIHAKASFNPTIIRYLFIEA